MSTIKWLRTSGRIVAPWVIDSDIEPSDPAVRSSYCWDPLTLKAKALGTFEWSATQSAVQGNIPKELNLQGQEWFKFSQTISWNRQDYYLLLHGQFACRHHCTVSAAEKKSVNEVRDMSYSRRNFAKGVSVKSAPYSLVTRYHFFLALC